MDIKLNLSKSTGGIVNIFLCLLILFIITFYFAVCFFFCLTNEFKWWRGVIGV